MNPIDVVKDAEVVLEYATEKFIMEQNNPNAAIGKGKIAVKIMVHG